MLSRIDEISLQASFAKARGSEILVTIVRGDTPLAQQKCVVMPTTKGRNSVANGTNLKMYDSVLFAKPTFDVQEGDVFIYVNKRYRVERVSVDRSIQTRAELICLQ